MSGPRGRERETRHTWLCHGLESWSDTREDTQWL